MDRDELCRIPSRFVFISVLERRRDEDVHVTDADLPLFPLPCLETACQKALSGMRKKYPRGVWADGAEIDWTYYNGRRERPSKAMKISIDLRL